ncbi:ABC transporter substrate-binding protein [Desertimonas flava]|uniref:ABC transporter substrate-binding protein n=1 Tax=Desertimonas flava TaxID=2064846 RepID=UPI000E356888|nr:ABC transporter substrate-binding protein [Desertimonas flava]
MRRSKRTAALLAGLTAALAMTASSTIGAATEPPGGTEADSDASAPVLEGPGENHVGDEGEPVQGGDLVYGIEADSANGWAPYRTSTATAGYVMFDSVSDPLFAATDTGEIAPMLVESWEANEDYTVWTFNIREGVTFHDGTPLDGPAVAFNIDSCRGSALTGAALTTIASVEGEGQTVTVTLHTPNVVLPRGFTERQCAYMFSPDWLRSLPDIPQRLEGNLVYDEELAATPAEGDPTQPVGLGAFVFESYSPGNGNSFRLVRNEDYWRGPNGVTGESLPYLDSIEGVVSVDIDSRSNSVESGEFDVIHSSNTDEIAQFLDAGELEVTSSSRYGDTNYIMLNVAEGDIDPEGTNADSPLLNVHCRRALAFATDQQRLIDERGAGLGTPATGPFTPDMIGYLEDSGYPTYDPEQAQGEMDTCLSELGTDSIQFSFNTTNDPFNVETNTLMISMWQEVFGDQVNATIEPIEQGQYIGLALVGTFNAFAWRNHGGIDPDTQNYWWHSASAAPIGALALNFGRFRDPDIDAQLEILRTNPDPAARVAAAEEVNRIFGEQVYNLWTSWAIWGVISQPYVNGVETNAIPGSDEPGLGLAFSGRHRMNQIWCNEGVCE